MNDEKRIKKEVKKLAKEEKFEEIYLQYGPKYFRKYVNLAYRLKDTENLRQEGKYIAIYEKYGKLDLESKMRIYLAERGKDLPIKQGVIAKPLQIIKSWIKDIGKRFAIGAGIGMLIKATDIDDMVNIGIHTDNIIEHNEEQYKELIDQYQKTNEAYAKKFDSSKQTDLEIVMRAIKDIRANTMYGEPKLDIKGYMGLDVMEDGGIGVCRNYAPIIRDRLNEINPDYNARLVYLYQDSQNEVGSNITNTILEENEKWEVTREKTKVLYRWNFKKRSSHR